MVELQFVEVLEKGEPNTGLDMSTMQLITQPRGVAGATYYLFAASGIKNSASDIDTRRAVL